MKGFFLLATMSRLRLGPTQPPIQWIMEALSTGVKWPGCEADHSAPSSAKVKNAWSYTSTPPHIFMALHIVKGYLFMAWYLLKHRDNIIFILILYPM
jgi:hypothetical protein